MAHTTKNKTTMYLSARTRRQWRDVRRLLRVWRPDLTVDRMLGETLRGIRLRMVRKLGADEAARVLGERASKEAGHFTGPPDRPRNVR